MPITDKDAEKIANAVLRRKIDPKGTGGTTTLVEHLRRIDAIDAKLDKLIKALADKTPGESPGKP